MFCTKCGSEIKAGNKFCTKCGSPVYQAQQKDQTQKLQPQQVQKAAQKLEQPQKPQTQRKEEAKGKGLLLALVIILVVVLAGGAAVIGYLVLGKDDADAARENTDRNNNESLYESDSEESTERKAVSEAETEENAQAAETEMTAEAAYVPDMNIHRYEFFVDDCSWYAAMQKAKESGGYLVRIESRAEYEYILSEIQRGGYGNIQFRIGARRNPDELSYYWVDENNNTVSEPIQVSGYWCENEWMDNEPSYEDGDIQENCVDIFYYSSEERWVWNDVPDDIISIAPGYSGRLGYIVEYED